MTLERGITMNKKFIRLIIIVICIIIPVYFIIDNNEREYYMSDDVLFGTFSFADAEIRSHPADLIVSTNVPPSIDDTFKSIAIQSGIDIDRECWIYSFEDKRMYNAKKKDGKIYAYDEKGEIATVIVSYKSFLWIKYDFHYYVNWKGENRELTKVMQAFVFP